MTYANVGALGVHAGKRDQLVEILTRRSDALSGAGCLLYEVGTNEDEPHTVFVVELWESAEAHRASLELESVQDAISEAMPILSGEMGGYRFNVVGSPLRS